MLPKHRISVIIEFYNNFFLDSFRIFWIASLGLQFVSILQRIEMAFSVLKAQNLKKMEPIQTRILK